MQHQHEISFKSDDLNTFFARYEKPDINQPGINESNMTAPPFEVDKEVVLKQLKSLNTRKGAGPGGLNPQIMCLPTIPIIIKTYRNSIQQHTTPKLWKSAVIKPFLPKITTPTQLKNYCPIAINSCLYKMLEKQHKSFC